MIRASVPLWLCCLLICPSAGWSADATPWSSAIKPLLQRYCLDCHGEDVQKGKLRLDTLSTDLTDPTAFAAWTRALDRMADGQMPPKNKPRPDAAQLKSVTASLDAALHAADLSRRAADGRTVLRRLNRVEYQNTLRDLLGVDLDVADMLPEDNAPHGFDNEGQSLNVSTVLMERYLEAADLALDAALASGPRPKPFKVRVDHQKIFKEHAKLFRPLDDAVAVFAAGYSPTDIRATTVPADGLYRIRLSAYGIQSRGEPVTIRLYSFSFRGGRNVLLGYYDLPENQPTVIELTARMEKGFFLKPVSYRFSQEINRVGAAEYSGPGVAYQWVEMEGPLLETWPPRFRQECFGTQATPSGSAADARRIITDFAARAFRRPLSGGEADSFVALAEKALSEGRDFEQAVRLGLKAVLCSPKFLFLHEKPGKLDGHALASRLSYFLWSTMPDGPLMGLAASGKLAGPDVLRAQVERMLKDPRAAAFTDNFTGQWLGLRLIDFTAPDPRLYPEFDELLQVSMVKETQLFFDQLLRDDLGVSHFVHSDFSMLNGRLAEHYGIPGVRGQEFRKVALPPEARRGGVMTMASVLKITANGTHTSPIVRGAWVMSNILGSPPPPPPASVPAVEPDIRGAVTIRQQLDKHRNTEACNACHARIDPPGFALENYDVIGGWRDFYRSIGDGPRVETAVAGNKVRYNRGPDVDPSGATADGVPFRDIDEFKRILLKNPDALARNVARKLLVYATGHDLEYADRRALDAVVADTRAAGHGLRSLVHAVVQSPTFQSK